MSSGALGGRAQITDASVGSDDVVSCEVKVVEDSVVELGIEVVGVDLLEVVVVDDVVDLGIEVVGVDLLEVVVVDNVVNVNFVDDVDIDGNVVDIVSVDEVLGKLEDEGVIKFSKVEVCDEDGIDDVSVVVVGTTVELWCISVRSDSVTVLSNVVFSLWFGFWDSWIRSAMD